MRRTWVAIGVVVALAAAVALPATAGASKLVVRNADMKLHATNGYKAYAFAYHQLRPRRHATVEVAVYKDDQYASYRVPALFTKHHIKADLGQFGRLNLRIRDRREVAPRGGARRLAAQAPGTPAPAPEQDAKASEQALLCFVSGPFPRKTFRGRIRFQAENGFTGVHADRAKGEYFSGTAHCSGGRPARGTFLSAEAGSVEFYASHYRGDHRDFLYASDDEKAGRVSIDRSVANYRGAVLDWSPDFMTAHVQPSAGPLAGSADYTAPGQWTGDLTASFLGVDAPVPLTGPDFTARLKHR